MQHNYIQDGRQNCMHAAGSVIIIKNFELKMGCGLHKMGMALHKINGHGLHNYVLYLNFIS